MPGNWRQRMRDNAVSQPWWTIHFALKLDKNKPNQFLDILLSKADYRSVLLEGSSANSVNVLRSILELTKGRNQKIKIDRNDFVTS